MSKRTPTPEELLLWREINRDTQKYLPEEPLEATPAQPLSNSSPYKGEVRRGTSFTLGPETDNGPTPSLPLRGREEHPQQLIPHQPLSLREARKRRALHGAPQATLDLHGYTRLDAYALTRAYILRHIALGHRHLVIITGKGRGGEGVLRTELPHWLNEPALRPHISGFHHAHPRDGGEGVLHVLLKRGG